jgi:hypothetical protein
MAFPSMGLTTLEVSSREVCVIGVFGSGTTVTAQGIVEGMPQELVFAAEAEFTPLLS